MKDQIRRIDEEYGFGLTDEEIDAIAKQAEEMHQLLQELNKVDVSGVVPIMKIIKKPYDTEIE
jgi:Asp-tRNA(Asn)/Glu-tRNA(Gln) amidotransferase C subunit